MLTLQRKYLGFILTCDDFHVANNQCLLIFLRLDDLPFPDCHFDLVRSLYIEFCVPEHKVCSFSIIVHTPVLTGTKWAKLFEVKPQNLWCHKL
jgi:hypothetical protein